MLGLSGVQVNKLNDPEAVRKRSKLMLPAPQISDRELQEIAKMGYAPDLPGVEDGAGSSATNALLASYGQTPQAGGAGGLMTPLRTPQRTPAGKGDAIMLEAENLARLRDTQTPLFGGQNPDLHPSDFSGITPKRAPVQTPNVLATPLRTPGGSAIPGATPLPTPGTQKGAGGVGATPGSVGATPVRDDLAINSGLVTPGGMSVREERMRQAEVREGLRQGLGQLPAPRNEYAIVVPELPPGEDGEDEGRGDEMELDMSEVEERQEAQRRAEYEALLRKRSRAVQRDLPRPPAPLVLAFAQALAQERQGQPPPVTLLEAAEDMVREELAVLLQHDAVKHPVTEPEDGRGSKKKGGAVPNGMPAIELEDYGEDELEAVRASSKL